MANQITVSDSGTVQVAIQQLGDVQVQISRTAGALGTSGYSGQQGTSGYSGQQGASGTSGISGYSGASFVGSSGISGYSGTSGASGVSGSQGINGASGLSGFSGSNGSAGASGLSGFSGQNGAAASSGYSGQSGYSGTNGTAGASGVSGYSGTNGAAGASGVSGYSGSTGPQGISGYSGQDGTAGASGVSGYSGQDGTAGASGVSGYSGIDGAAGASGVSGFSGAPGSATPGGANTEVQYNDAGTIAGSNAFTFNNTTNTLSVTNITGTLTTNAQPNITSTGNLVSLNVRNSANTLGTIQQFAPNSIAVGTTANATQNAAFYVTTQYWPNASTNYPSSSVIRSRGNASTPTTAVSADRIYNERYYVYNGNVNVLAVSEVATLVAGGTLNGNSDQIYAGGQWSIITGNPTVGSTVLANSTATSSQNQLAFTNSGAITIVPGAAPNTSLQQTTTPISITNYGLSTANLVQAGGILQQKARGNRDGNLSVQAGDHIGRFAFAGHNGTSFNTNSSAQLRAVVDSGYTANSTVIPMNFEFVTVDGSNVFRTTSFYSNGLANFSGSGSFTSPANDTDTLKLVSNNRTNMNLIRLERYGDTANLGGIGTFNMYRTGGTQASPAAVANGDIIYNLTTSVYGDSGNIFVDTGGFSIDVNTNFGNGVVTTYANYSQGSGSGTLNFNYDEINLNGNINYTKSYGQFTSNVTQTNGNVGNPIIMTLNNDEGSNGVSIVSGSQITTSRTGLYNIQFSAQIEKTDAGTDEVEIWLTKNGAPVANSATRLAQQGNNVKGVAAWNWLVDSANINDYYEIAWASTDANMQITAIDSANTLSGVEVPSLIVTIVPVGA